MKTAYSLFIACLLALLIKPCLAAETAQEPRIKFAHIIIQSRDIPASRHFYAQVLKIPVLKDWGNNGGFLLKGDIAVVGQLQYDLLIFKKNEEAFYRRNESERVSLYFETDDPDGALERVKLSGAKIIHEIEEQPWGQLFFRVYDPDGHIVDIADPSYLDF